MAAYMKTTMPFYGVSGPARRAIGRELSGRFPPADPGAYREGVLALWALPHREEKYLAIAYARAFPRMVSATELPLYRRLVVEGAWWDFVDEIAVHLVGHTVRTEPDTAWQVVDGWADDPDMWLRRTAILSSEPEPGSNRHPPAVRLLPPPRRTKRSFLSARRSDGPCATMPGPTPMRCAGFSTSTAMSCRPSASARPRNTSRNP